MLSSMGSIKHIELGGRLEAEGHAVLRFDFSARGKSNRLNPDFPSSRITYSDQVEDLAGAVAFVRAQLSPAQLFLIGSSMGGSVSLLYAATDPSIDGIVTFGSPAYPARPRPPHFPESVLAEWEQRGHITVAGNRIGADYRADARTQDIPRAARAALCPKLFLHGTADEVVPLADGQALAAAAEDRGELVPVEGADHRFSHPGTRKQLLDTTLRYLAAWSNLPRSSRG